MALEGVQTIQQGPATKQKLAVILFNLGGPDAPESIKPFLLNLFNDPAILRVPFFVRPLLARIIAWTRLKPATENYALLGGKSPLLELTVEQAGALEKTLPEFETRCFIAMRYWHPFSEPTAREVLDFAPDRIVLLPLYPHYSTTTTGSSFSAWRAASSKIGLVADVTSICCYFDDPDYAAATARLVQVAYDKARAELDPAIKLRVLFSAHGLPETIIKSGDPYQYQIQQSTKAVLAAWAANGTMDPATLDWAICYQSRATPQKWIGPSTEVEIERAAHDKVALLVMPIAFVSEHSETLVELDVEYRLLAEQAGVPGYFRVPAQNADPAFIASLAGLVRRSLARGPGLCSHTGIGLCPIQHRDCPHARAGATLAT